jgi:nitrogen fixation protein NifU and related proteins
VEHPAREGSGGIAARRRDSPLPGERFHGKPLVYLDSAATTQKPRAVIDRLSRFYQEGQRQPPAWRLRAQLCGDQLTVHVRIAGGLKSDATFLGSGCAISKASASLMTECVKGLDVAAFRALAARFNQLVTAPAGSPVDDVAELTVFSGVRRFPVRARCALLAWQTLAAAIDSREGVVSTE